MKIKRLCLTLAAAMVLQLGLMCPAMAADTDTYEEDPQIWREEQQYDSLENPELEAEASYKFSAFTPRALQQGETLKKGVDVSVYQKVIDWEKAAADGVDFAFIRAGYRGWGSGKLVDDSYMQTNIENALKSGVQVGVYVYSQATTIEEAQEEADYLISRVKGYDITLPLVIDFEYAEQNGSYTGRLYEAQLTRAEATEICNAFCAKVEAAGYRSAVYANKYMVEKKLNAGDLGTLWLANYCLDQSATGQYAYKGDHEFWQCTSSGTVDGIPGRTDLNFWYDSGKTGGITLPFTDVERTRWSYNDILHAYEKGLIKGRTTTTFDPSTATIRAELALMLYRMAGSPAVTTTSTFTDLEDYFRAAVTWAQAEGVVTGRSATIFDPQSPISRQDLVTMLYRMAGKPETSGSLKNFNDGDQVASYALPAVRWAVENGLLQGSYGNIDPNGSATREQVAAFLIRYMSYQESLRQTGSGDDPAEDSDKDTDDKDTPAADDQTAPAEDSKDDTKEPDKAPEEAPEGAPDTAPGTPAAPGQGDPEAAG